MARAQSLDVRERVVAATGGGRLVPSGVGAVLCGKASTIRWHARYWAEGVTVVRPGPALAPARSLRSSDPAGL